MTMTDNVKTPQPTQMLQVAQPATLGGNTVSLVPKSMDEAISFAKLMARAGDCIRPAFRNNPGACLAISLQAFRWGADPFAVANKAYVTIGKAGTQIAYESQMVHAIVNTSQALSRRLRARYEGTGQQRKCVIIGYIRGEDEALEYESPTIAQIAVKNSPLWQADPDQQLHYYSVRAWARRYLPEVLLGIYTPDEVQGEIIDMTPAASGGGIQEQQLPAATETVPWQIADAAGEVYEFEFAEKAIDACRKILIGNAADPVALATAWENNAGFIVSLGQEGMEAEAVAIERLHAELAPRIAREPDPEPEDRQGTPMPPRPVAQDEQTPPQRPDAAPEQDIASAPRPAAAPPTEYAGGDQRPFATTDTAQPGNDGGNLDNGMRAGAGPRATTAASRSDAPRPAARDAFWSGDSLTLTPMPVRGSGSLSKLEWKTWPALILPRVRQAMSVDRLNQLYQDNADLIDRYERECGGRAKDEILAAFDDARMRLS